MESSSWRSSRAAATLGRSTTTGRRLAAPSSCRPHRRSDISVRRREARLAGIETKREIDKRELLMQGELAKERHTQAVAQAEMGAAQKVVEMEHQKRQDEAKFELRAPPCRAGRAPRIHEGRGRRRQRSFMEHALPAVADTVAQSMGNMRLTVMQGAGGVVSPFQMVLQSVMDVFEQYAGNNWGRAMSKSQASERAYAAAVA
jgi:hypothetical protein